MAVANSTFATRKSYVRGLKALILHFQKLPEQCSAHEIKAFLVHCRDNLNYSASTTNLRVCSIKYYFREVVHRLDLVVKIPNPRVQKYKTEVLSIDEMQRIFRACKDTRQLLIIHLFYDTGIRVRELVRLRPSDFDKHACSIAIRNSKGEKTRVLKYGQALRQTLNQYYKVRGGLPQDCLIDSYVKKEAPISSRGIQHIVRQIVKRSGIKKKISPHTFRHTFAVHFLNFGGSLFHLQQLLGHEYLSTTLHYLKYAVIPPMNDISVLDNTLYHDKS